MLRFHTQTGGATLTAQQPQNNIVRTTLEAMAAVLGGTQSLHTNSFDEALALPTERAVKIALRTQQVIGYETGVANVADPLGGSYYVESLTDELAAKAWSLIEEVESIGGMSPRPLRAVNNNVWKLPTPYRAPIASPDKVTDQV